MYSGESEQTPAEKNLLSCFSGKIHYCDCLLVPIKINYIGNKKISYRKEKENKKIDFLCPLRKDKKI